jgi:hypothetical protein
VGDRDTVSVPPGQGRGSAHWATGRLVGVEPAESPVYWECQALGVEEVWPPTGICLAHITFIMSHTEAGEGQLVHRPGIHMTGETGRTQETSVASTSLTPSARARCMTPRCTQLRYVCLLSLCGSWTHKHSTHVYFVRGLVECGGQGWQGLVRRKGHTWYKGVGGQQPSEFCHRLCKASASDSAHSGGEDRDTEDENRLRVDASAPGRG